MESKNPWSIYYTVITVSVIGSIIIAEHLNYICFLFKRVYKSHICSFLTDQQKFEAYVAKFITYM